MDVRMYSGNGSEVPTDGLQEFTDQPNKSIDEPDLLINYNMENEGSSKNDDRDGSGHAEQKKTDLQDGVEPKIVSKDTESKTESKSKQGLIHFNTSVTTEFIHEPDVLINELDDVYSLKQEDNGSRIDKKETTDSIDAEKKPDKQSSNVEGASQENSTKNTKIVRTRSHNKNESFPSWREYRWTCGICYEELPDIAVLRSHSVTEHNKCAQYACCVCKKSFNFNPFIGHAKTHHHSLWYRCHYCDAALNPKDLKPHIMNHLESVHPCRTCGVLFPDESTLQQHLDSVEQKVPKKRRRRIVSQNDRTCPTCNKVFKYVCMLKKHLEIHKTNRKKNFVCMQCGRIYYTQTGLRMHQSIHSNETHVCDVCHMSFKNKRYLERHRKTFHTLGNVKQFVCETCGRSFRAKANLLTHKIIHSDLFPYACQYCNKKFNFRSCLISHERRHTGVKPYACDECDRTFCDWGNYNKHMKCRHNRDMSKKKIKVTKQCLEEF